MADEMLFDYLHMAIVEHYANDASNNTNNDTDSSSTYLSQLGYRVGYVLSERISKDNPRFRDELETVKFLCKELWQNLFKKQVDNLRTNHQGVYVIQDTRFRLLQQTLLTTNKHVDSTSKVHMSYLAYSIGLIRGILTNLGYPCRVTAEIIDNGVRFQIEVLPGGGQKQ